ncbi:hypothetical protein [Streptomyces sp. AC512_CC834]|uniref:hypothetical protein n=1 Tax=Streptomyces sp. AC512_CC834 TaxID=2823691 RepID=UPI001C280978|nr:hypothetical protein [Streptomyces sp. AC512_CC834]
MRAAEVAADDVRLALASAEEPAGLSGEFGLVPGPVLLGQAVLEVGVDQLVQLPSKRHYRATGGAAKLFQYDATGRNSGNSRNGTRLKTVLTDVRPVGVKVLRPRPEQ